MGHEECVHGGVRSRFLQHRTSPQGQPKEEYKDPRFGRPTSPRTIPGSFRGTKYEALRFTTHRRVFRWPANGKSATPIMLVHSWHDCS